MFNRSETKDVFEQLIAENGIADISAEKGADSAEPDSADTETTDETEPTATSVDDADDTDVAEAPDDASDEDSVQRPSLVRRAIRPVLIGAASLFVCAAVGLAGFFGWQVKQQHDVAAATAAALTAAKSYAVTLTSIDNAKIDQNFAAVLDGATGQFKDMYSQSSSQLRQLLIDNKAVSHGIVVDAAIKSASKDKVDVLVFVDQTISNSTHPDPRIDRSRIAITMEHLDGRWLASQIDVK